MKSTSILHQLEHTLIARQKATGDNSYVASLYQQGINKILEKVGEEATETILAAKDYAVSKQNDGQTAGRTQTSDHPTKNGDELVKETADLWFHSLVMLVHLECPIDAVFAELERRFGTSGHIEKASRSPNAQ